MFRRFNILKTKKISITTDLCGHDLLWPFLSVAIQYQYLSKNTSNGWSAPHWWTLLNWITSKLHSVDMHYLLWTQHRAATLMEDESISQWRCPRRTAWQRGLCPHATIAFGLLLGSATDRSHYCVIAQKNVAIMKRWADEGEEWKLSDAYLWR